MMIAFGNKHQNKLTNTMRKVVKRKNYYIFFGKNDIFLINRDSASAAFLKKNMIQQLNH